MAVAFDAVGPSSAGTASASATTLSWSHTCSGGNRLLTVSISVGFADSTVSTTATYNGVAMISATKVYSNNQNLGYIELFYLVAPATGSHTVAITCNTASDLVGGSVSFTGVKQSAPVNNINAKFGNDTTPTVTIKSSVGDMVVNGVATGTNMTATSNTQRWMDNFNNTSAASNGAQSTAAGAASVVMSYTMAASDWWGIVGMTVVAASVPAFVASNSTSYTSTTSSKNVSVTTQAGDLLVVYAGTESDTFPILTPPNGNGVAFTLRQSVISSNFSTAYLWTGVDSLGGTGWTLSADIGAAAARWGFTCVVFRNAALGTSGSGSGSSGSGSLSLTTTKDNAMLVTFTDDHNAVDGTSRTWNTVSGVTPTVGNGMELTYATSAGVYTVYGAYYNDTADAGSKTMGISAPTGQKWSIVGVEIWPFVFTNSTPIAWLTA